MALAGAVAPSAASAYPKPPVDASWYWELAPPAPGLAGLPATSAAYPAPGSANIWDTDLFQDSNTPGAGIPTGPSPVVQALHAAGHYSICYVEAGAWQTNFPDGVDFAPADYGGGAAQYQMQGYKNEWWFDISGFANYVAGQPETLTGAAVDIASGLQKRFSWCALEGQDAVEADDLDGYANTSATGAPGAGWGLTKSAAAGFERWIAYTVHQDGLAWFMKNDPGNGQAAVDAGADGLITEECNTAGNTCGTATQPGEAMPFLKAGLPVLDAEYVEDGESTPNFCPADNAAGIWGALFSTALSGGTYESCWGSTPHGNWVGSYGAAGYDLAAWSDGNDVVSMPGVSVGLKQGSRFSFTSATNDTRAMQSADQSTRAAGAYYDPNQVQVQLSFSADYSGNLSLYALDWGERGRRETITVGGATASLTSDFSQGAWVSFPISQAAGSTLTITVTNVTGPNAVLSGIFLGGGGTLPPAPPVPAQAPQGNWVNSSGADGYDLAGWDGGGDVASMPDAAVNLTQGSRYLWSANTTDARALESADQSTRAAATYYDPNQLQLQLSFSAAYSGNLSLYAVDWDALGRREAITVDGVSANLTSDFSQGAWVSFPISQAAGSTLTITVTNLGGPNAVLSGIFLGGGGTLPPAPPVPAQAPQGSWVGSFGAGGYDLAGWDGGSDVTSMPGVGVNLTQGSRYLWSTNTTDVRALESTDQSTRAATTYYDPNQIQLQLSFATAFTGNLELYAVDWDGQGRRETITVGGVSANLSDDFSQGAWLSFPISQAAGSTLTITVTNVAGPNAVLSGVFLN